MDNILSRRSIRKYTKETVSNETVNDLLKAAMAAPSANNQQPWHFIVINDRSILDEIPKFHPYSQMLKDASTAILVCGDEKNNSMTDRYIMDCSAATENILLAAHSKGLGACWVGIYPENMMMDGMKKLIGLPEDITPVSLIPIGYPAEQKEPSNRFDNTKIHFNKWGNTDK